LRAENRHRWRQVIHEADSDCFTDRGPVFFIGFAPLYQNAAQISSASAITISGTIFDGVGKPIPDAVLEFWNARNFVRVPTSEEGRFSATLEALLKQDAQSGRSSVDYFDVLMFMRGLLKPVRTRVYLGDPECGQERSRTKKRCQQAELQL